MEVKNHDVLAAVAFMTSSISSLSQWRNRGTPSGKLVTNGKPHGRVIVIYLLVMTERLFPGMCGALVCTATIYRV